MPEIQVAASCYGVPSCYRPVNVLAYTRGHDGLYQGRSSLRDMCEEVRSQRDTVLGHMIE